MKYFTKAAILLFTITISSSMQGQNPVTYYTAFDGEIIVALGNVAEEVEDGFVSSELTATGAVFNEDGVLNKSWETSHTDASAYSYPDLSTSSISLIDGTRDVIAWESVYDGDDAASSSICPGMIGWGDYSLSFEVDDVEFNIYVSTLDGNWMKAPVNSDYNKFVIYLNIDYDANQGVPVFDMQYYRWNTTSWEDVEENERLTFWDLNGLSRERDKINILSDNFTISDVNQIPDAATSMIIDINLYVDKTCTVINGRDVEFKNFYDEYTDPAARYVATNIYIARDMGIYAEGDLRTRSVSGTPSDQTAVYFRPSSTYSSTPRESWLGLVQDNNNQYGEVIDLESCQIIKAKAGVDSKGSYFKMNNVGLDSCRFGIITNTSQFEIQNAEILRCYTAADLSDNTRPLNYESLIDDCDFRYNHEGIVINHTYPFNDDEKYEPEENLLIRDCYFHHNLGRNISGSGGLFAVRDCNISTTGAVEPYFGNYSVRGDAINNDYGYMNMHGTNVSSSEGYGYMGIHGSIFAAAGTTSYGDNEDRRGENCFDGNYQHLYTHYSYADFGHQAEDGSFVNAWNAFKNPTRMVASVYKHIFVGPHSNISAVRNYWHPTSDADIEKSALAGEIDIEHSIFSNDSVRCPASDGSGGISDDWDCSPTTKRIIEYMSSKEYQRIYDTCSVYISDSLSNADSYIYAHALKKARLLGPIEAAESTLREYGLRAISPSTSMTPLEEACLMALRSIYMMTRNKSEAVRCNDTLKARMPFYEVQEDSVEVRLYDAMIMFVIDGDTTEAKMLVDTLYTLYSDNYRVKRDYWRFTHDTTVYIAGSPKVKRENAYRHIAPAGIQIVNIYPNPAKSRITLEICNEIISNIAIQLYDINGRLLKQDYRRNVGRGRKLYVIDIAGLRAGNYTVVLQNGRERTSKQINIIK